MKQIYADGKPMLSSTTNDILDAETNPYEPKKGVRWADIENANSLIKAVELPRRKKESDGTWSEVREKYVEVKERVIAYRRVCPNGTISTEMSHTDNYIVCEAVVTDNNGSLLAKGHSREMANKQFAYENAETSAIGRALGFCGFGISIAIATAEDMEQVEDKVLFDEPIVNKDALLLQFEELYSKVDKANILNGLHIIQASDMPTDLLKTYVERGKRLAQSKGNTSKRNQPED